MGIIPTKSHLCSKFHNPIYKQCFVNLSINLCFTCQHTDVKQDKAIKHIPVNTHSVLKGI